MGTYATTTSLATRMVGTSFDSVTTALAQECISDAEAEIDKYLSKRYDVSAFHTSTGVPPVVNMWAKRLAEGFMHQNMARGTQAKEAMDRAQKLIDGVLKNLDLVASYKLDLVDSSGAVISDMSNSGFRVLSNTSDYHNTFNEDDSLNWAVDQDKLDDIDSERS